MEISKNILDEMQQIQNSLYQDQSKNMFFKKTQKNQIAKTISEQFSLKQLLANSVYIIPSRQDCIYLDYPTLKMFIHEEIYQELIDHILILYNICIKNHGHYSVYINLSGFTMSAAERHKNAIIMFSNQCVQNMEYNYVDLTKDIYILNTPSIMATLMQMFKPFFAKNIATLIKCHNKKESEDIILQTGI
jgi:hypothetical protein